MARRAGASNRGHGAIQLAVIVLLISGGAVQFQFIRQNGVQPWVDDAHISYTYARNLAQGRGLVFNEGERVWGFTSPAYTLLLAGFTAAGMETSLAGQFCGILFITLSAFFIFRLLGAFFHPLAGLLAALHHLTGTIGSLGMVCLETQGLICVQLAFLDALRCRHHNLACGLAALSCLVRPDSLLFVLPALLLSSGCRRWRSLAWFILPGLAWLLFAWLYFGDVLPNTLFAKTRVCTFSEYVRFNFFRVFYYNRMQGLIPSVGGAIAVGFACSLSCLVRLRKREDLPLLYALAAYPWILLLAYGLIGPPMYHTWEIFSARFFHWFAILFGLTAVLFQLGRHFSGRRWKFRRAVPWAAGALAAVYLLLVVPHDARLMRQRLLAEKEVHFRGVRHRALVSLAGWCNDNIPAGESLAAPEVGTLKYYSHLQLVDRKGLVTRSVRDGEKLDEQDILLLHRPAYYLLYKHRTNLAIADGLHYRALKQFDGWGYMPFTIMEKCAE
jgi:hypothetical protein